MAAEDDGRLLRQLVAASSLAAVLGVSACSQTSAPIPPIAETAPACAHVPVARDRWFIIFFDKRSDRLGPRQQKLMGEIASYFLRYHISSLEVLGYTDSSEIRDPHLGAHRAQTVRAVLEKAGIRSDTIVIHDFGANHPLVPTPPGVPEPQNRRVEFRPVLHSSDDELPRKRECEEWLREHAAECGTTTGTADAAQACTATKSALEHWYLPD